MITRRHAIEILHGCGTEAPWPRHCYAVADSALKIGKALEPQRAVDCDFVWSSALLHDIGRHVTHDPVLHGVAGFKYLSDLGHHEEAHICASHILFGLHANEAVRFGLPGRDFVPDTIEAQLVTLADFLMEFNLPTTLERRFALLRRRNAANPFFLERLDRALAAARSFKTQIEKEIGESIEGIIARQDQGT